MNRTQLLLNDAQDRRLREMASREGKSISEILRKILDEYFGEKDRQVRQQGMEVLSELDRIREKTEIEYGTQENNPVEEAREERDRQVEEAWKPSS
jgi:hypothetical protein